MHLDRLISVLETVSVAGRPVSATDLQQATNLPRPTCYRLLQTLTQERLLDEAPEGGSLIGERLVRIALLGRTDVDLCQAAAPALKDAAISLGEAVFLSRFRKSGVEIIHVEVPSDPKRSFTHPGLGYRPMHACSCSKAIAAYAEDGFREAILQDTMRAYTEHTRTTPDALRAEFETILERGYAECVEEIEMGVSSVAAPVQIGNIGATFSVGATGPIRRFTSTNRAKIGTDMIALSAKVSAAIQLYGASKAG